MPGFRWLPKWLQQWPQKRLERAWRPPCIQIIAHSGGRTVTTLTPSPRQFFLDNNGRPLVSGQLFVYEAGTSTKATTWTDSTGSTPNSNPIVLDYRGECGIWIEPNVAYKYVLAPAGDTDPPTNPIWTVDQIESQQLLTLYGGVDSGSANAYVLNYTASFSSYVDGTVIYWVASNSNTGASTLNVNGLGAVPIVDPGAAALFPGAIEGGRVTSVIYLSGLFYLTSVPSESGSFTTGLTGVSGTVTGTVNYARYGRICTLYTNASITGTSTSTAMTMTNLPQVVLPTISTGRTVPCYGLRDNSVTAYFGYATVAPVSANITFALSTVSGTNITGGGFTAANLKGVEAGWAITYPI